MKALALAIPLAAAAGTYLGVHAATPWFSPRVDDLVSIAGTTAPVASGNTYVLATVPPNEHFVLSAITVATVPGPNGGLPFAWSLLQRDSSGNVVVKCPMSSFTAHGGNLTLHTAASVELPSIGGLGVVFEPGTDILVKYNDWSLSSPTGVADYLLIGHYAQR